MALIHISRQGLMGFGVVDARRGDVVELLAPAECRLGDVDDV
jgi:hypothetical protein